MYDIICYYVQQIVYWTLYFGVAGFVIYIFIGQQIHDARIMLGKDKKEESKETKNIWIHAVFALGQAFFRRETSWAIV